MVSFTQIMVLFSFYTVYYNGFVPVFQKTCYLYPSSCTTLPVFFSYFGTVFKVTDTASPLCSTQPYCLKKTTYYMA